MTSTLPSPRGPRESFPTELSDRVLHAWARIGFGFMQIGLELTFDRPLAPDRLAAALERLRLREPLVGCRFAEDGPAGRPRWQPLESYRPLTATRDPHAYERFRVTPLRAAEEPQLKACLDLSGPGARLFLAQSHELADAGGLKQLAADLARFYSRPDDPPPLPAAGSRSMAQVIDRLHPRDILGATVDGLRMLLRTGFPRATKYPPHTGDSAEGFRWAIEHVPPATVAAVRAYGRRRGATLNDLLLAAFLVAAGRASEAGPDARLRVMSTVDLRRYVPGKRIERLCNLSGFEVLTLPHGAGSTFETAVDAVARQTTERKQRPIGMVGMIAAPLFERTGQGALDALFRTLFALSRRTGNLAPSLTNMGAIEPQSLSFDGCSPSSAWLLVPAHLPPYVGAGASGYRGALTLTAATTPSFEPRMRAFLRGIHDLLAGAAGEEERT